VASAQRLVFEVRNWGQLPLKIELRGGTWAGLAVGFPYVNLKQKLRCWIHGRFGPMPEPERWVFLVGCYNSGTTLLHDLLAENPQVGSLHTEGQFLTDQLVLPKAVGLARLWAMEPEHFVLDEGGGEGVRVDKIKRQWGAKFDDPHKPVLIEKSPTNAARTRWLQRHFAPASFIGIVRDGFAVAEGIHRKAGHSLEQSARQWARSNEIMLDDFEHLERKMVVRYEDLTARPAEVLAETLEFLGLQQHDEQVGDREFSVHEQTSKIRNMNDRSMQALSDADREVIQEAAGDVLRRLGYS